MQTNRYYFKKLLSFIVVLHLFLPVEVFTRQTDSWNITLPGSAEIKQRVLINTENAKLHVPSSFEGRTAKEWRNNYKIEFGDIVRYQRQEANVELRSRASIFDFDYTRDIIDVQLLTSNNYKPGANSCMDCHGGDFARTSVTGGIEKTDLDPKPYVRGNSVFFLDDASSKAYTTRISHWVHPSIMLRAGFKTGHVKQGRHKLSAKAWNIGATGIHRHRLVWSGNFIFSDLERFEQRKTFTGKATYRLMPGLRLGLEGGIFFDGYTQFGTRMSEMGLMSTGMSLDSPNILPSLFGRFKDDRFGYLSYTIQYEHKF